MWGAGMRAHFSASVSLALLNFKNAVAAHNPFQ